MNTGMYTNTYAIKMLIILTHVDTIVTKKYITPPTFTESTIILVFLTKGSIEWCQKFLLYINKEIKLLVRLLSKSIHTLGFTLLHHK